MSLDLQEIPLSAPFHKARRIAAFVLIAAFFAVSIPFIAYEAIKRETRIAEIQRADAFARGTWCNSAGARFRLAPVDDDMLVVFQGPGEPITGRAHVNKISDGIGLSLLDPSAIWVVKRANANTLRIWQMLPVERGSDFEDWVRCTQQQRW